jgi:hypothetical protein
MVLGRLGEPSLPQEEGAPGSRRALPSERAFRDALASHSGHGGLPTGVEFLALGIRHLGLEFFELSRQGGEFLEACPETGGQSGEEGCSEGRNFGRGVSEDSAIEDVGLKLHQLVISGGSSVSQQ